MFCRISAEKQLSKYAEWTAPRAGMFLWLKLTQVDDSMDIFEELKAAKVVVVPGDPICANRMHLALSNTTKHTHTITAAFQAIILPFRWLRLWAVTASQSHKVT